jgi:hypothetical protein
MENIYDILERLNRVGQPLNEGDERRWVKDPQDPASKVPAYIRKAKDAGSQAAEKRTDDMNKAADAKVFRSGRADEADFDEGNLFTGNLAKARAAGKKQADLDGDGDMEKVQEGGKPDFIDLDKDGNKTEPMKKAAKDKAKLDELDINLIKAAQKHAEKNPSSKDPESERNIHKKYGYRSDRDDSGNDDDYDEWGNEKKKRAQPAAGEKRGRGRPKGTKRAIGARGPTGKSKLLTKEGSGELQDILARHRGDVRAFLNGEDLSYDLYDALYDYYLSSGEMPYGVAKAREGDPYEWIANQLENDINHQMTEGSDDIEDQGEYDQEGDMAKDQLHTLTQAADELASILDDDQDLPEWVQSKITKALDYINASNDYMDQERHDSDMMQVNELSPDTLSSYADKAKGQRGWAFGRAKAGKEGHGSADPQGKFDRLWNKRADGYNQAVAKGARDLDKSGQKSSWDWSKDDTPAALKRDKGMSEDAVEESGLQAYLGKKKYGKDGMAALQKAGREGASKEKMAQIRAKHDKTDEGIMDTVKGYARKAGRAIAGEWNPTVHARNHFEDWIDSNPGLASHKEGLMSLYDRAAEYRLGIDNADRGETVLKVYKQIQKGQTDNLPVWATAPATDSRPEGSYQRKLAGVIPVDETNKEMDERKLTKPEMGKREKYVKSMKKSKGDFEKRYGERGEEVMYATATKMAKKKDKKAEEVEETTTSGSVATSTEAPKGGKKGGIQFGKGVYETYNSRIESAISESMDINISTSSEGRKSITVTATDDDASALAQLLKLSGIGQDSSDSDICPGCGSSSCGCEQMDEDYANSPEEEMRSTNYMTQTIAGGLNGPKLQVNPNNMGDNPLAMDKLAHKQAAQVNLGPIGDVAESKKIEGNLWNLYKQVKQQ